MAKYVGKVFQIPDRHLGIRGKGSHYVKISWFDPRKKVFRGDIITSLEEEITLPKNKREVLNGAYYKQTDIDTYSIIRRKKIQKVRNGSIIPIPVGLVDGLSVWSGISGSRIFTRGELSGYKSTDIKIKKK